MDKTKYTDKCLTKLSTKQFLSVETDPTKIFLRKIKSKVSEQEFKRFSATGSCPGKFYGTAKMNKLPLNGNLDEVPLQAIISNINTATYNLAKCLSKLLAPLRESEHTVKNTNTFGGNIKKEIIRKGYKMISFNVKSLFTNVLLDQAIGIILKRIYDDSKLQTTLTRPELKKMLLLCKKVIHLNIRCCYGFTLGKCTSRYLYDRIRKVTSTITSTTSNINVKYKVLEKICGRHHLLHKIRICRVHFIGFK